LIFVGTKPLSVEIEDLVGRGELVRIPADPVDDVCRLVHAATTAIVRPRSDVIAFISTGTVTASADGFRAMDGSPL
jgi:hypothetical protein